MLILAPAAAANMASLRSQICVFRLATSRLCCSLHLTTSHFNFYFILVPISLKRFCCASISSFTHRISHLCSARRAYSSASLLVVDDQCACVFLLNGLVFLDVYERGLYVECDELFTKLFSTD